MIESDTHTCLIQQMKLYSEKRLFEENSTSLGIKGRRLMISFPFFSLGWFPRHGYRENEKHFYTFGEGGL